MDTPLAQALAELRAIEGASEPGPEWSSEGVRLFVAEGSPAQERFTELVEEADGALRDELGAAVWIDGGSPDGPYEYEEPPRCPHCRAEYVDCFSHTCEADHERRAQRISRDTGAALAAARHAVRAGQATPFYDAALRRQLGARAPRTAARRSRGRPIRRRGSRRTASTRAGPSDESDQTEPPSRRRFTHLVRRRFDRRRP